MNHWAGIKFKNEFRLNFTLLITTDLLLQTARLEAQHHKAMHILYACYAKTSHSDWGFIASFSVF